MYVLTNEEAQVVIAKGFTLAQIEAIDYEHHKNRCREDLIYYAEWAIRVDNDNNRLSECHRLLLRKLNNLVFNPDAKPNLMVFMPSGCGKSSILARVFVSWYLAKMPGKQLLSCSHNSDFAESENSARCQTLMIEMADVLGVGPAEENKRKWKTTNGSVYRAVGCGAGILGNRGDFGLIDDPFGKSEDAQAQGQRDKVYRWYREDFITRLKPDARKVLMHQRMHLDDLAGRLLLEEPNKWEILFMPAVFEGVDVFGREVETDELGRKAGDSIWPEYFTTKFLEERKSETTVYGWHSMYQQRPQPLGGVKFTGTLTRIPKEHVTEAAKIVRAWDQAATQGKGDWTVGVKMQRSLNGGTVVLDVVRIQGGPEEVRKLIIETARKDGAHIPVCLAQDPGSAGKYVVADLTKALYGFTVIASPETGKKDRRADPFAAQVNLGNVSMVSAPWNKDFSDELEVFPGGRHDDQVDACSRAFGELIPEDDVYEEPEWDYMPFMLR